MADVVEKANLGNSLDQGNIEAGKLHVNVDGVTILRNTVTGVLSAAGGAAEIYVDGGSLDAVTYDLTLTDNDAGTVDIVVPFNALVGPSAQPGNLITAGTPDGKPYLDAPAVEALATEDVYDLFGVLLFKAFSP